MDESDVQSYLVSDAVEGSVKNQCETSCDKWLFTCHDNRLHSTT